MSETLKFNRVYFKKHNTSKIKIKNGTLVLNEDCDIVKIDKTEFDYQKAVVELDDQVLYDLTLSQTTNFRLFQTQRVCGRQFWI